jgi:hypothetical protein
MRCSAAMVICLLFPAAANSALKERDINYESGGVVLRGSLAYDEALPGRRPGLLVVHEWSGLNEHARHSARRLAEAGYVALALDMYGEAKHATFFAHSRMSIQHASVRSATASVEGLCWRWRAREHSPRRAWGTCPYCASDDVSARDGAGSDEQWPVRRVVTSAAA